MPDAARRNRAVRRPNHFHHRSAGARERAGPRRGANVPPPHAVPDSQGDKVRAEMIAVSERSAANSICRRTQAKRYEPPDLHET
ncbi:hypothetical protein CWO89_02480 [Bradyrhizobium sp. Leo170]|nr:hypothetical protein CWO89_02480 [Bradyrhizobium sp. Leo170]